MLHISKILAGVILLVSAPAMADHHFSIKAIDDIKVTNTNLVHFELRDGTTVTGNLPNCDVMEFVDITGPNNLGLYANGVRSVRNGTKITFLNLKERTLRKKAVGSCQVQNLGEIHDNLLLAKT